MGYKVLSRELIRRAGDLAAIGLPNLSIAKGCGVSEATFYAWLKAARDGTGGELEAELMDTIQAAHTRGEAKLVKRLHQLAEEGDSRSTTWLLSHGPQRDSWSDAAATRREVDKVLGMVCEGILGSRISLDAKREVLTIIRAKGVGLEEEP